MGEPDSIYCDCECSMRRDCIKSAEEPNNRVHIANLRTGARRAYPGFISHFSPVRQKIVGKAEDEPGWEDGIYALDVNTGELERLIGMPEMQRFAEAMEKTFDGDLWRFSHPYWSPNGEHIMFQIKVGESRPYNDFIFYADADGSNVQLIGKKPMHVQWWNNETVFGHDWQQKNDKYMRRWNLEGKAVETVVGYGNHGAVSPNRQWVVTESWYGEEPIYLWLYRRGYTEPVEVLYEQAGQVGDISFWDKRSHTHPAFSRDGTRVYFNAITPGDEGAQVYAYDLDELMRSTAAASGSTPWKGEKK